ncbi:MAG: hypothetical protein O7D30_06905, partial [Rickettsia endosymbiont of Ixodes persulcatus]|nr:hypothetical protein [Rickettsia endosymbiont of Ixodes persulcatus]
CRSFCPLCGFETKKKTFPDRILKRVRTEIFTKETSAAAQNSLNPFLVMYLEQNKKKTLGKLTPFRISKTLEIIIGKIFKASKIASGDLLVEVENGQQSVVVLDLNEISDYKVSLIIRQTLNSCLGVISEDDLLESSEEEILKHDSGQGVVAVRRIYKRTDGQERSSNHIVIEFAFTVLHESIKAGYLYCKVRPYIPNHRRFFKCLRFYPSSVTCRRKTTCAKCGATNHLAHTCDGTFF